MRHDHEPKRRCAPPASLGDESASGRVVAPAIPLWLVRYELAVSLTLAATSRVTKNDMRDIL
eukprot:5772907-Prymnesium_polylepis.1